MPLARVSLNVMGGGGAVFSIYSTLTERVQGSHNWGR